MARRVRSVGLIRRLRARFGAQLRRCGGLVAALRLVEWFGVWLGDVFGLGLLAVFGGAAVRCRAAARSGSGEGGERADARERVVEVLFQGQRAGIRSVHCRAVRVSRPGIGNSRRRRVAAVGVLSWGSPIWLVHRPRLCARAAITVQALLV